MESTTEDSILEEGQIILIAFHLYKRCFSIRNVSSRKVIGYTDRIVVRNARFPVSVSGRLRVLREKRKNVHAYVQGCFEQRLQQIDYHPEQLREAYYNPYVVSAFVDRETIEPIAYADLAICENGKVYYYQNNKCNV